MAVVPLPHPDSTIPGESALYWLVLVVGARSGPNQLVLGINDAGCFWVWVFV